MTHVTYLYSRDTRRPRPICSEANDIRVFKGGSHVFLCSSGIFVVGRRVSPSNVRVRPKSVGSTPLQVFSYSYWLLYLQKEHYQDVFLYLHFVINVLLLLVQVTVFPYSFWLLYLQKEHYHDETFLVWQFLKCSV